MTILLTPLENHTTATVLIGEAQGAPAIIKKILGFIGGRSLVPSLQDGLNALSERIEADISQGKIAQHSAIEVPIDQIESALADSLAQI